jgi:eukaryotic-like serine/threonine-protein kinase
MIGETLSHYRILRPLGAGGMGEVFVAEDTKLGRQVALKILARETASDPDRRARFEREARAVAALNHPGIVTIHSVEEDQGLLFITMELVEGRTLAQIIPAAGMPLNELLKIAIPLADAVGTAHQRGITHRDLKPANVMISDDGRVKVLDFGLAKQQSVTSFQGETVMAPTAHVTAEGKILGTVAYMSPEQAEGKPVDQRSDIFSLGIVLFEMATGRRPFKGDSNVSVLSAVLKDTPPLVTDLRPDLPREIARIIRHCLAKDPEARYQSAKDVRNDLRALKDDSDSGELARQSAAAAPSSGVTVPVSAATTAALPQSKRRRVLAGIAAIVVIAVALAVGWWTSTPAPPKVTATTQVTTDGVLKAGLVTDGARLYFNVSRLQGKTAGGSALAQVAASGGDTVELASLSPLINDIDANGTELLVSETVGTGEAGLAVMPVVGGTSRRLGDIRTNTGLDGAIAAWSPDKSQIAYAHGSELRVARSDGSGSRTLVTTATRPLFPRWSPDGGRVRYSVAEASAGANGLWEVNADGTNPHQLLPGWKGATACCGTWAADGRYFVFEADGNIWALAEDKGILRRGHREATQLTFGPVRFSDVIPSRNGRRLFVVGNQSKGRLVRYDATSQQFVPYLGGPSARGMEQSRDGQWVAYTTFPDSKLWRRRADGSEAVQLTFGEMTAFMPRWSPDGSQIVFGGQNGTGPMKIYAVAAGGGAPRRLTSDASALFEMDPTWSPDGRQLVFATMAGDRAESGVHILDLESKRVTLLPESRGLFSPRWSPDGRFIAAFSVDSLRLLVFDVAARTWNELLREQTQISYDGWSPDSRSVLYRRDQEIRRTTVSDHRTEVVASLKGLDIANGSFGDWVGYMPDGTPMLLLDAGSHDIYALDWDAP